MDSTAVEWKKKMNALTKDCWFSYPERVIMTVKPQKFVTSETPGAHQLSW